MKYFIIIIFLFIVACNPTITNKEVFIRDTTYIVKPEVIRITDTLPYFDSTMIEYYKQNTARTDTFVYVKFLPKEKKIFVTVKPDRVRIHTRDTLVKSEIVEKVIKTPFMSKVGIFLLGMGICIILLVLYYLYQTKVIK